MMNQYLSHILTSLSAHKDLKYVIREKRWQTDFLRFYHSQTNYNISKDNTSMDMSIYKGKKSYSFSIDNPSLEKIDVALAEAMGIIDKLPDDPDFVDIETDLTTAEFRAKPNNPELLPLARKTAILQDLADAVKPHDFEIYGTFICNHENYRLINSNGLNKVWQVSPIYLEVKAVHNVSQITVLETFGGEDFKRFDPQHFRSRLLAKIRYAGNEVVDVDPGHYDVVLAPRCIAEFVQYLSYGTSARALDQHSSYFEDQLGQQLFPQTITITDDPLDNDLITSDYNHEGHIYKPLTLIDRGVFKAFTCDSYYHHKTGLPKNGNSASCLKLAPGDQSLEAVLGKIKRGLYISSLHYMNFINPKETSLTGLTRDGTFLVEDGKITKVVNNLRFTERIDRIIKNIVALENRSETVPFSDNYEFFSIESAKAPHVLVKDFNITSSTKTI